MKKSKFAIISVIIILSALAIYVFADSDMKPPKAIEGKKLVEEIDANEQITKDFKTLLGNNPKADAVIAFIDKNIAKVSEENASTMVDGLEEIQKKDISKLKEKYFNEGETIQNELHKVYQPGFDLNKLDDIQDQELKDLLVETRDLGYRLETAEGTYFPMMNYENYQKYSPYVTADIKDYIEILTVETNKVPAKDGALIIGWDEIIKRALNQEQFIKNHGSSAKADEMRELQKKYLTFILYGLNNTPLFSYDSKVMSPDAEASYLNAVNNNGDSELMQMLGKYMDVLAKTNYKFSEEADKFRKEASQNM